MMRPVIFMSVLCFAVLGLAAPGHATPTSAFSFTTATNVGLNQDNTVGWAFNVVSTITVRELGVFDYLADGLGSSHQVALWEVGNNSPIVVATVPAGTGGSLDGWFRYSAITPVTLQAGHKYVIGALFTLAAGDQYTNEVADLQFDSAIGYLTQADGQRSYTFASDLAVPSTYDGYKYMDANFKFDLGSGGSQVPDVGSTLLLLGMGLAGLTALRKWRGPTVPVRNLAQSVSRHLDRRLHDGR